MPKIWTAQGVIGMKFNRLTILSIEKKINSRVFFRCLCDCGNEKVVNYSGVISGKTASCGCYAKECATTHGNSKHPLRCTWNGMINRCTNPKSPHFKSYGARGILVCKEWIGEQGFISFVKDMGPRPIGMTLDRINNDGNYCKENCRWADAKTQARNKRATIKIHFNGETLSLPEWSDRSGIPLMLLRTRLHRKWPVEKLFKPKGFYAFNR